MNAAARLAARLRQQGKRVVFTNGCFDLLHPGHLHVLEQARAKGDVLFVGVNTDASVARLKGPLRPIQPLEVRQAVLAAVRFVDHVVAFDEDTPYQLIKVIKPQVLVKGGDYAPDEVVGADLVQEVVIVPLLKGYSTTDFLRQLLERIRRLEA